MKTAVISFTESGRRISERIAAWSGDVTRFCFRGHSDGGAVSFDDLSGLMSDIFEQYEALVFVSSVGIAVRAAAPHIRSKLTDPAVTAVDDGGRFAVSVLSGHIGGANELTRRIADILGAVPVITTSTDVHGKFSPDMFAKQNGLVICDMKAAKAVAAAVLNGEPVGVRCSFPHSAVPPELHENGSCDIGISVSESEDEKPFGTTLCLLPRNLVVGIGCREGADCESIRTHVMSVFSGSKLDIRRVSAIASIDIKAEEQGLNEFCERFSLPLLTFTAEELMAAKGKFSHSDFVERTTGADNVCERAAVCAGGTLKVPKTAANGVTAAVAELPVYIDFERKDN